MKVFPTNFWVMATLLEYFMVKGNGKSKNCDKSSELRKFCTTELLLFTLCTIAYMQAQQTYIIIYVSPESLP